MSSARWLDRDAAAQHMSLCASSFRRLVDQGRIPAPSHHLGDRLPRWDRAALDAAMLGALGSSGSTDAETAADALAQKLRAGGSRRAKDARGRFGKGIPLSAAR